MEEKEPVSTEPVAYEGSISLPEGSGIPGCQETNECYIPYQRNRTQQEPKLFGQIDDTAAHTVTSGTPEDGPDGIFDSSILAGGT